MGQWWVSLLIYSLFISSVLLIVMSGVGYYNFTNEILIIQGKINFSTLFGIGIFISIIFFIGIWFFLLVPKFLCHYLITFPSFTIILSFFIAFTTYNEFDDYLKIWGENWNDNLQTQSLQMKNKCCGWFNYSDRGLDPCPFFFDSGCFNIISNFLKPRYEEILISSLITLIIGLVSFVGLIIHCAIDGEDELLAKLDSI